MPSSNLCWGIEIGAGAVKALKLERDGDRVQLVDFMVIPHKKVLSTPDMDSTDAIRVALGTLVAQRDLSGALISVSVPGHQSFARFAKLPPVEPKKAPDLVKFEAAQQIPFPIEQVEWDYQTFVSEDSPEIEVGIFAVTRDKVNERLALLEDVGISPDIVTIGPVAVYNAIAYDLNFTEKTSGTIVLDIGAVSSDLIVADAGRVWIRTFPVGGHTFTEAVARAFKLDYTKADKLKRDFESSQHKKQVFQAMKPAFEDLLQDIQRSIQYYKQLHPESNLTRMLGIGATFQLPGLRKFLAQRLGMDVVRLDQFHKIGIEGPMSAEFASTAMQLSTAYGLALQGFGMSPINANLIPLSVVRQKIWKRKTAWVAAAAALSLVAGAATFVRPILDRGAIVQPRQEAQRAVDAAKRDGQAQKAAWEETAKGQRIGATVVNYRRLVEARDYLPQLITDVGAMLASADPQPEVLRGETGAIPPGQWRVFRLESLQVDSASSNAGPPSASAAAAASQQSMRGMAPAAAQQSAPAPTRGRPARGGRAGGRDEGSSGEGGDLKPIDVTLVLDSPNSEGIPFVARTVGDWLKSNAERPGVPYRIAPFDPNAPNAIVRTEAPRQTGAAAQLGAPSGAMSTSQPGSTAPSGASDAAKALLAENAPLSEVAPIPSRVAEFPDAAPVYRYTLKFQIIPYAPGQEPDVDAPEGDQSAMTQEPSSPLASATSQEGR
jgi:type IV pilus assembly protein PilM